jgi:hypothetical protein
MVHERGNMKAIGVCLGVLVAACSSRSAAPPSAPPPIFGGEGALVGAPKEQPLPADSASAKAAAGPCAAPSPPSDAALVDDFEDGDPQAFKAFQREGWWFAATDATEGAKLLPERGMFRPERLPAGEGNRDNLFAAHLKAEGQKDWGAAWGVSLRYENKGVRCPINLSAYAGLRFRAKGPGTLRIAFGMPETQPPEGGGTCNSGCYDFHSKVVYLSSKWDDYLVRWDRLEQGGWGAQVRFDPARITGLQLSVRPPDLPVDFWIDDLAFVGAGEAETLTAALRSQPAPPVTPAPSATPASSLLTKGGKPK